MPLSAWSRSELGRENWYCFPLKSNRSSLRDLNLSFHFSQLFQRWAKFGRPSGAGFWGVSFHWIVQKLVLTHTLKRWAKVGRPSGAGFCCVRSMSCPKTRSHAHSCRIGRLRWRGADFAAAAELCSAGTGQRPVTTRVFV